MSTDAVAAQRRARGGVLVIGGGFGGATVARLLGERGATIVGVENSMLFTPMLPEVAAGVIEMRHVVMPLALVCPHAERIIGRVLALDLDRRRAEVETDGGLRMGIEYEHVVIAVGAVPRTFPIPGLLEHAVGCSTALDGLYLRKPAAAAGRHGGDRRRPGAAAPAPHLRLRGRWVRGGRDPRRAARPRPGRPPTLPGPGVEGHAVVGHRQ